MVVGVVVAAGLAHQRLAQMAFQHLRHQPGRGAAQGRELLQQRAAGLAALDGGDQRIGLTADALEPRYRALFSSGVCGIGALILGWSICAQF
jgi:hypothetical protein